MLRRILFISFLLMSNLTFGQLQVKVTGVISDEHNFPLRNVNVVIPEQRINVISNDDGEYTIYSKSTKFTLVFSLLGYKNESIFINEEKAGRIQRDVNLFKNINILEQVAITSKREQLSNTIGINMQQLMNMPAPSANFEAILKTLPGVSVNNELTAQFNVRGGNPDDNATYINNIEINRPVYVRNSQQEGLSFINSDLVTNARFSPGGFEAKFADKLASILDVKYEIPDSNEIKLVAGILNSSFTYKKAGINQHFLLGARYKNNSGILSQQDLKGRYNPNFADVQFLYSQHFSPKLNLNFLGNINGGVFNFIPENRATEFGTQLQNGSLFVNYSGSERTSYFSSGGGVTLNYLPSANWSLKFINTYFSTVETENTNVLGQYYLQGLTPFSNSGFQRNYVDNFLKSNSFISEFRSEQLMGDHMFSWGLKWIQKDFREEYNEISQIGVLSQTIPNPPASFKLNNLSVSYFSAFIQDAYEIKEGIDLQLGVRAAYNKIADKLSLSPRLLLAFRNEDRNNITRFSLGVYHQDPDFKTMRNWNGQLLTKQDYQRSYNFTVGHDYAFNLGGKPLKFTAEIYYKYADKMIPFIIDHLKINYLAHQKATGTTYGADFTIGGELVEDLLSYFRLSLMHANQTIVNSGLEINNYINVRQRRPTDQLINASVFFQDKLPSNPSYKVHLNLLYGSPIPVGLPNTNQYSDFFKVPSYKRIDIGFSKDFLENQGMKSNSFKKSKQFDSIIAYMEIFNLLNMNNTASYLWVKDLNGAQYAVPNYHTGRQLNIRLIAKLKAK